MAEFKPFSLADVYKAATAIKNAQTVGQLNQMRVDRAQAVKTAAQDATTPQGFNEQAYEQNLSAAGFPALAQQAHGGAQDNALHDQQLKNAQMQQALIGHKWIEQTAPLVTPANWQEWRQTAIDRQLGQPWEIPEQYDPKWLTTLVTRNHARLADFGPIPNAPGFVGQLNPRTGAYVNVHETPKAKAQARGGKLPTVHIHYDAEGRAWQVLGDGQTVPVKLPDGQQLTESRLESAAKLYAKAYPLGTAAGGPSFLDFLTKDYDALVKAGAPVPTAGAPTAHTVTDPTIQQALDAIRGGKDPQAVAAQLAKMGYTPEQIQQALGQ